MDTASANAATCAGCVPLVAFERGAPERLETVHLGVAAVVDGAGREVLALGDAGASFPLRSTAKPFQLLPFLIDGLDGAGERGAALDGADLAVLMSSHNGEPMHTERIAALQQRLGVDEDQLRCGVHPPHDPATRHALLVAGREPGVLHCNCSGKHTAMLAVCAANGWAPQDYLDPAHPLQRRIHALLCALAGLAGPLEHSIDGCSLPTWWVPVDALARLFARLALPAGAPAVEGRDVAELLARLFAAGVENPQMIAGSGRLDTDLMRAGGGRIFAKTGASGMYAVAVAPGVDYPDGLGIACKVLDGDPDSRVREQVILALLERLGIPIDRSVARGDAEVANQRGIVVGRYRPLPALAP